MDETVAVTSVPDSYPCPHCGAAATSATGCPACGRAPDADAIEVIRLNAELAGLGTRLQAARAEVTAVETQMRNVRARRDAAAYRVRAAVTAAAPKRPPMAGPPVDPGRLAPATESRLSTLTAQNVLFALGGLLLVVAAAVFTAVAWAQVGVAGRAAILAAATATVLAVPPFAARRGLVGAAETLAAVGLLMILMDGYAAWSVDLLGVTASRPEAYAAAVAAATSAIALGYGRLVGLPGPAIAALLIAQPVFPLVAAALEADAAGWSVALSAVAALNVAVLRHRRFVPAGAGLVAYGCGFVSVIVAALVAVVELAHAGSAGRAAAAGGALVLAAAVATGAAMLARHREAQLWTSGLLTVAAAVAAGGWALFLPGAGTWVLRLATIALVIAEAVAVARVRLPEPVGRGPWVGALAVITVPALGVVGSVVLAAGNSVTAARPVLDARLDATVAGPGWDVLLAVVAVLLSYVILLPSRFRTDLVLTGGAAVGLLAPAAFGLPWWSAAVFGMLVAAGAIAPAARARTDAGFGFRLGLIALVVTHALVTGLGAAGVAAGVCAVITLLGVGAALIVRRGPLGTVMMTAGLLAVAPAVWLGLLAADVSATVRVRAIFAVAVLLCGAAHGARRWLAGYAPEVTGVALLLAAGTPLWAIPGGDPAALYVAAALILVASLTTGSLARGPQPAIAVAVLVVGLLGWTGRELSAILVDPYAALASVWSGDVPATPAVSWATVAAMLMSAVAAGMLARPAAAPVVGLAVPLALAAAGAAWPSVPLSMVTVGLAGLVAATVARSTPVIEAWRSGLQVAFGVIAAAGIAGSTPVPGAMLTAFALLTVAGVVVGVAGRDLPARVAGWVGGTVALVVVAYTAGHLAGLAAGGAAIVVLAAAALAVALEWVLAARRPSEAIAVAATAHSAAVIALLISGSPGHGALVSTLWAVVLAVRALRPDESPGTRLRHVLAATGCALLGWWLFLAARQAGTAELYTAPAAVLALLAGGYARRVRPELPSWTAYGPALAAAFLPTLAVIAGSGPDEPQYARRLLLGVAGLAVLVAGALARLQAPVVTGGAVVILTALHELAQVWDLVPRWVPLAVGGLLLVGVATTLEQRRRDLNRLRDAVSRLS
ncbi:SCO7613 C-terminal domain-containing membrane protein [Actinoplanes regularis]|uniref:Uncharacterized protein n=1 Tax=Actinoplanes regularis TaxID=52697 RepID=A0A239CW70_9ACTN|nr:hypothetical protein [Actinoplanes regularis]GIE88562.1 hypothetical protein Are01nite_50420 [Actinoplanes regularis]SNS23901.1 hypothetical protein SAMN06264365_112103 [Actinoplanes regularis]